VWVIVLLGLCCIAYTVVLMDALPALLKNTQPPTPMPSIVSMTYAAVAALSAVEYWLKVSQQQPERGGICAGGGGRPPDAPFTPRHSGSARKSHPHTP
jgi:hypothetical protein